MRRRQAGRRLLGGGRTRGAQKGRGCSDKSLVANRWNAPRHESGSLLPQWVPYTSITTNRQLEWGRMHNERWRTAAENLRPPPLGSRCGYPEAAGQRPWAVPLNRAAVHPTVRMARPGPNPAGVRQVWMVPWRVAYPATGSVCRASNPRPWPPPSLPSLLPYKHLAGERGIG